MDKVSQYESSEYRQTDKYLMTIEYTSQHCIEEKNEQGVERSDIQGKEKPSEAINTVID